MATAVAPRLQTISGIMEAVTTVDDRREAERFPLLCPVRLWGVPEQRDAVCVNISRSGLCLGLGSPVPVGTLIRVTVLLPL